MAEDGGGGDEGVRDEGGVKGMQHQQQIGVALRGHGTIFDVPEFPSLRRVIPLPKRRRTTIDDTRTNTGAGAHETESGEGTGESVISEIGIGKKDAATMTTMTTSGNIPSDSYSSKSPAFCQLKDQLQQQLNFSRAGATDGDNVNTDPAIDDDGLNRNDGLLGGGGIRGGAGREEGGDGDMFEDDIDSRHVHPADLKALGDDRYDGGYNNNGGMDGRDRYGNASSGFRHGFGGIGTGLRTRAGAKTGHGDRNIGGGGHPLSISTAMDHSDLSRPMSTLSMNNTSTSPPGKPKNFKKRKVPIAAHARLEDILDSQDGEEEDGEALFGAERGVAAEPIDTIPPAPPPLAHSAFSPTYGSYSTSGGYNINDGMNSIVLALKRRGKLSLAAQAGLQLKEMLKSRKRQLAAVLGAFSYNDSLALDQALSSRRPFSKYEYHFQNGYPTTSTTAATGMAVATTNSTITTLDDNGNNSGSSTDTAGKPLQDLPKSPSHRLRKRRGRITVAGSKRSSSASVPVDENKRIPECTFSFEYDSPTSERVRKTSKEVANLQTRFDEEFSRQAARAAEAARQAAAVVAKMQRAKQQQQHTERSSGQFQHQNPQTAALSAQTSRTVGLPTSVVGAGDGGGANGDVPSGNTGGKPIVASTSKAKSKKKKKRSALANASNPHHLRNYVPSRLPNSGSGPFHHSASGNGNYFYSGSGYNGSGAGGGGAGAGGGGRGGGMGSTGSVLGALNLQSYLGPFPIRFLSASLSPRKKRSAGSVQPLATTNLTNPEEEWICAFCEYRLFYGDDDKAFDKAVSQRKVILKRRRRALERAAAAAAGRRGKGVASATTHTNTNMNTNTATGVAVGGSGAENEEVEEDEDDYGDDLPEEQVPVGGDTIVAGKRQSKVRVEQDRDRDKGDGGTFF